MKLDLNNTKILITGSSSGMGRELAKNLASEASTLILVARREKELDKLATALRTKFPRLQVYTIPCDLADPNSVVNLTHKIQNELGDIDILINAAGVGHSSFLESTPLVEVNQLTHLNVMALTHLCHAFLPGMLERRRGGILNFSSYFGVKIMPGYATYAGSKHYVSGFTETLRAEVSGTGVVVSGVYPGPVNSAFWDGLDKDVFAPPSFLFISVEQCARETLKAFRKGRARIIPSIRIKLFLGLLALTPAPLERLFNSGLARMQRKKICKP